MYGCQECTHAAAIFNNRKNTQTFISVVDTAAGIGTTIVDYAPLSPRQIIWTLLATSAVSGLGKVFNHVQLGNDIASATGTRKGELEKASKFSSGLVGTECIKVLVCGFMLVNTDKETHQSVHGLNVSFTCLSFISLFLAVWLTRYL